MQYTPAAMGIGAGIGVTTMLTLGWVAMAIVLAIFVLSALRQLVRQERGARP